MIALTTPAPVYWLLDLLQLLGALGCLGGLLFLAGSIDSHFDEYRIRRLMKKGPKTDRGAGGVEGLLAWTTLIAVCAAAWYVIGAYLLGRVS